MAEDVMTVEAPTRPERGPEALTQSGRVTIDVTAPADGRHIASVVAATSAEVQRAADDLRQAQGEWEAVGANGRARYVLQLRDWVLDNEPHLLDLMQAEAGKVRQDAAFETAAGADVLGYFARRAERYLRVLRPRPHNLLTLGKALQVNRRPYPLVGVITPWNFPLFIPLADLTPALMAGAAVLLKPAEQTPLTALELGRGWQEIGAPDVLRVISGNGDTGAAVVDAVDYVQFTGSTDTGRAIAKRAAERLIPCSLELGGKDPMIVLEDADVTRAAAGALWGGMFNAGQVCTSVERVYVHTDVYEQFVAELGSRVGKLRQGMDSIAGTMEVGAMADPRQVTLVHDHVQDALARGAHLLNPADTPGVPRTGSWLAPTVLVDVDHSMQIMREETFGPTLPVMRVRDENEAVELANDSTYGLSATVWTRDHRRGERVARRLEVGAVNINDVFSNVISPAIPMGGWRDSGLGARYGGAQGLLRFCRAQGITSSRVTTPADQLLWYPYSPGKSRIAGAVVRFAVGRGRRRVSRPEPAR
jgi:acyl-CoA reductase-like NAD-dependent aldehyde dehydrogenase